MVNIQMLRRLITMFREDPLRLHMNIWWLADGIRVDKHQLPACGTVGCIAGWTCFLDWADQMGGTTRNSDLQYFGNLLISKDGAGAWASRAREILGIDIEMAIKLFDPKIRGWLQASLGTPDYYRGDPAEYAELVIQRITGMFPEVLVGWPEPELVSDQEVSELIQEMELEACSVA